MNNQLSTLSSTDLQALAMALRSGRLTPPFTALSLNRVISMTAADSLAQELNELAQDHFNSHQIATTIELLIQDRSNRANHKETFHLVTTGPEVGSTTNRDTAVVVRELFANANQSVLVAGYAIYQGRHVFKALAERMQAISDLKVQMFLDIQRPIGDTSRDDEIVRRFAARFRQKEWPQASPLPHVYYYPSSLEMNPEKRTCLHAKCIVIDQETVFVSSANFTEAAQNRNIEVGLLIHSKHIATQIKGHFHSLIEYQMLQQVL